MKTAKNKPSSAPDELDEPQLNIVLTTDEDDIRPVYISGNFNNWHTQDERFQMERIENGLYHFRFPDDFTYPDELLYKFTKGDWSEVEIDRYGNRTENRSCRQHQGVRREHVDKWRKNWLPFRNHFLPKVELISDQFEMPQLGKKRRVWALLPHDYETSTETYPVMYLHDAQNLFNEQAKYGNWEIDKKLAVMSEYKIGKIIVVAVEHAEQDRIKEYNVGKTVLGAGDGKKYIRFITETLKPYIDKRYRTKPEQEYTGIGGSSMGGLVSIFAGIMYPEVYGKLMIFSPSLWVVPKINFSELDFFEPHDMKIYLYAGGDESATMVRHVKRFQKNMTENSELERHIRIKLSINMFGKHTETFWSDEFPKAIEWLFFSTRD